MEIRAAQLSDAAEICDVLRRSITELCVADHHNDPNILSQWLVNKTPDNLRRWIVQKGQTYRVAVMDDNIIGVGAASQADGILLNYVAPDYQYRGVSKALMAALEAWLFQQGQCSCYLTSTVTARGFYERLGYLPHKRPDMQSTTVASLPMIKYLRP